MSNLGWDIEDDDGEETGINGLQGITLSQLLALVAQTRAQGGRISGGRLFLDEDDDDEYQEEEEEMDHSLMEDQLPRLSAETGRTNWFKPQTEPNQIGTQLLLSGNFGRVGPKLQHHPRPRHLARMVLDAPFQQHLSRELVLNNLVPNTNGTAVASCPANIYSGQFSGDSSFYYTCSQDFKLHVFDTHAMKNPGSVGSFNRSYHASRLSENVVSRLNLKHTIQGRPGRWTITDANLSPDNERMIYSSITPTVYMAHIKDPSSPQIPICFSDDRPRSQWGWDDGFGIWSCRFSADGNEVVAGGAGHIFVYDLLANRRTVKISAHGDDVNSCCWADTASGNVLVSASDDTFLKVWDRRSLGSSNKPSGILCGHTEGITYVSAKGDGRYILSNGKDQAARLWDLRKMCPSSEFDTFSHRNYGHGHWDYRHGSYPRPRWRAHPKDCSVMTYRGHAVLRTLIRCHFSPVETTGGQYIYSGSADGRIHIWSLDGRIVQVLDRCKTLPQSFDSSEPEPGGRERRGRKGEPCVRDVSWHTEQPILMSAAWENDRDSSGSVVAQHEWKGLSKLGGSLEDWVAKSKAESEERRNIREKYHVPGSYLVADLLDDDDDPDYVDVDDEDED